jgi:septal ring-binding cell division protein DamX
MRWTMVRKAWLLVLMACSACTAAQQQVTTAQAATGPQGEEASYTDPWGTQVAWSSVPAASSAPSAPGATETDEAKPKAEEEAVIVTAEPETTVTTTISSGEDDDDD